MNWSTLGAKLDAKHFRSTIVNAVGNATRSISIGRSSNIASVGTGTPIEVIDGDKAPSLEGHPFLSTTFRRGSFTKNMYTPSTLRIEVGREWLKSNRLAK